MHCDRAIPTQAGGQRPGRTHVHGSRGFAGVAMPASAAAGENTYGIVRSARWPPARALSPPCAAGRRGGSKTVGGPLMYVRKTLGVALAATLLTGIVHVGAAAAATPEENLIAAGSSGPAAKLGPWLANVHEEYQRSSNKRAFRSRNSMIKVQGGAVGVDLYANDAAAL